MGGVTVAPQPTTNDNDPFLPSFDANLDDCLDFESLFPSHSWPMEDITGEVHDLLLRESMNWLPWTGDAVGKTGSPIESLDSQLLAQTLQLDGLFDQDANFDLFDQVGPYDELSFDSPSMPSQDQQLPNPSTTNEQPSSQPKYEIMDTTTGGDSSTDEDDQEDDSDDDEQPSYMYLPKRQVETILLDKITHHLHPDKLAGILSIVSSVDHQVNVEEVEIDLSSLGRVQLVQVLRYVDACIAEQQGGPAVKLEHYLDDNKTMATSAAKADGPTAALTKKSTKKQPTNKSTKPRRRRTRRKPELATVPTRPTRPAALHKRRMLEDMLLLPSDNDDDTDGLDQQVMVTFGEEQMDFKVVENQTIVHQPHMAPPSGDAGDFVESNMDHDDDDEEIDIM